MSENTMDAVVILGPTASGKTALAALLADRLNAEVVSVDSRQVFRHMSIGTGKDPDAYIVEDKRVPVHMIDIADPGQPYDLHRFLLDCTAVLNEMRSRASLPVLCGGSGLYLNALLKQFAYTSVPVNDELRNRLSGLLLPQLLLEWSRLPATSFTVHADLSTSKRVVRAIEISTFLATNDLDPAGIPKLNPVVFGLNPDVETRRKAIADRLEARFAAGLVDEVRGLISRGVAPATLIRYGLEYRFVTQYVTGAIPESAMRTELLTAIQQFAKRQMTFFRKMEREGLAIHWLDPTTERAQNVELMVGIVDRAKSTT